MEYMQVNLYKRVEDQRRADRRRDAERWRLLRQGRRRSEQDWLSRQGCWLLCQLGRWMVRLGQGLQRAGAYQPGPMPT
ncbi:MAG: hypothetical protein JXA89_08195 [Anaerolineae bacterium]|nr:hypothetical protein [Anaerolineae bacterium]